MFCILMPLGLSCKYKDDGRVGPMAHGFGPLDSRVWPLIRTTESMHETPAFKSKHVLFDTH